MTIVTFLDSGVLILAARGNDAVSDQVISLIEDSNRKFVYTSLLEMEVLPKCQFHKRHGEMVFYQEYFRTARRVRVTEKLIGNAMIRATRHGIAAMDALHLQAAIAANAAEFITSEKPTKPMFRETEIVVISL